MKTGINHKSHLELSSITEQLLLNGTLTKCPGLLYGKVGIAIFSKYTICKLCHGLDRDIFTAITR